MIREAACPERKPRETVLACDLAVAGGGMSGLCAALTAARAGLRVVLVQDRPVLGGNASSEVRLWILGATSHMGNNNRWAREGGIVDEILVENLHRNPEGNPVLFDALLLEKAASEPNLTLLLNTAIYDLEKSAPDTISALRAWCSQNSTSYLIQAPLFCDATGDGVVGFLAGAAFRMGAESRDEFGEGFAPDAAYGELLGHSLYFYSRDTGRPVRFIPPSFALKDITRLPRYRDIRANDSGCRFWWLEYGGRLDTVHDTEAIKWELWRVAYGVWDYIKNSGRFPEAETMTLEWIGTIPGKRESRRFEGDCILTQQDIVEQRQHPDAVSFGGWAMDLHPADGVFSELSPCTQWHAKGVYQIPYRTMYSRNISNLFVTGRLISVSHVAFGSTRVMATCAHNGQAAGMAAVLCRRHNVAPREVPVPELQQELLRSGQYIPGLTLHHPPDLAPLAALSASSTFELRSLPPCGETLPLDCSRAMLLPVEAGPLPAVEFLVDAARPATLRLEVRDSLNPANFTPEHVLCEEEVLLPSGIGQKLRLVPSASVASARYVSYCLLAQPDVAVHLSDRRVTGILSLAQSMNRAVAKAARQDPPPDSGIDSFEFWLPQRRPAGKNLAIDVIPPLRCFEPSNVTNGVDRPALGPNAWVAAPEDLAPALTLRWAEPRTIARLELAFDTDFDHPLESVLMGHPEHVSPFCVSAFRVLSLGRLLYECADHHSSRAVVQLPQPLVTTSLSIEILSTHGAPAALFAVRCYAT